MVKAPVFEGQARMGVGCATIVGVSGLERSLAMRASFGNRFWEIARDGDDATAQDGQICTGAFSSSKVRQPKVAKSRGRLGEVGCVGDAGGRQMLGGGDGERREKLDRRRVRPRRPSS